MRARTVTLGILPILLLFVSTPARADAGADLFDKECSGCHTIGGGDSGGPDLKGVAGKRSAAWLERVIVEPDTLTAEKDPTQLELVKKHGYEMPNLGLSREDARAIIAYLRGGAPSVPAKAAAAATPGAFPPVEAAPRPAETVATPELVFRGRALFTGGRPFANGGAACTACHGFAYAGVAGGVLAADLSARAEAVGEQGLRGMLKSLSFPIMRKTYAGKPLTEEEISALSVFAKDAVARKYPPTGTYFPAAGVGVFFCLIAGLTLYKRRIR